jgi:hypothetical protein
MKQRRQEELAWDADHADIEIAETMFTKEILPGLQGLSLTQMYAAAGLSRQYSSFIRRGLKVAHPRHWERFRRLAAPSGSCWVTMVEQ